MIQHKHENHSNLITISLFLTCIRSDPTNTTSHRFHCPTPCAANIGFVSWININSLMCFCLFRNVCRYNYAFSDFPFPEGPDFAHNTAIAKYLDDYVDHFNLAQSIQYNTKVTHVVSCKGMDSLNIDVSLYSHTFF